MKKIEKKIYDVVMVVRDKRNFNTLDLKVFPHFKDKKKAKEVGEFIVNTLKRYGFDGAHYEIEEDVVGGKLFFALCVESDYSTIIYDSESTSIYRTGSYEKAKELVKDFKKDMSNEYLSLFFIPNAKIVPKVVELVE